MMVDGEMEVHKGCGCMIRTEHNPELGKEIVWYQAKGCEEKHEIFRKAKDVRMVAKEEAK